MSLRRKLSLDSSFLDGSETRRGISMIGSKKLSQRKSLDGSQHEVPRLYHSLDPKMSLRQQTIAEESLERSDGFAPKQGYLKHDKTFRKLFPEIPQSEFLKATFTCSMQKEFLYHGKLFVSENHVCFYSSVLLKDTKVVIPVSRVCEIEKQNSTLSMLSILTTGGEKFSFAHIRNWGICYQLLQSICSHAQVGSLSRGTVPSPARDEYDTVTSCSSVDDSLGFGRTYLDNFSQASREDVSWIWRIPGKLSSVFSFSNGKTVEILFYIYLVLMLLLLLTSGYIGLMVMALEEELNSLRALSDLSSRYREYQTVASDKH